MGRMITLVNFTKMEQICVGKSGEQPIFQILKEMKRRFNWNLDNDLIELVDSDILRDIRYKGDDSEDEMFVDRGQEFPWRDRSTLWDNIRKD